MPELIPHLKIFVSSPSDVEKERQILDTIVNNLNRELRQTQKIQLELLKWETDCYPDVGEYSQDVINRQIGQDYDIFVGILWQCFGSPTKNAESGTQEEFNIAYEKYKKDPKSVRIMFYFNDTPPNSISSIEPDQIEKIKSFQKELKEKGVFYFTYKDLKDFETYFRLHIMNHIQNWKEEVEKEERLIKSDEAKFNGKLEIVNGEIETQEESGLLDLYESFSDKNQVYMEVIERMTQAICELGERMDQRTEEILSVTNIKNPNIRLMKVREPINKAVGDLNHFNARMKVEIPLFANTYNDLMSYFTDILLIQNEFNPADKDEMQVVADSLILLLNIIRDSKNQISNMKDAVVEIPRIALNFNIAKRNTINILSELIEEMEKADNLTVYSLKSLHLKQ